MFKLVMQFFARLKKDPVLIGFFSKMENEKKFKEKSIYEEEPTILNRISQMFKRSPSKQSILAIGAITDVQNKKETLDNCLELEKKLTKTSKFVRRLIQGYIKLKANKDSFDRELVNNLVEI